jgi:hypothetical protein
MGANCLTQPPADPVSGHSLSGFFRNREAKAWRLVVATLQYFKQEKRPAPLLAFSNGKKLGPLAQFAREAAFCLSGQLPGSGLVRR